MDLHQRFHHCYFCFTDKTSSEFEYTRIETNSHGSYRIKNASRVVRNLFGFGTMCDSCMDQLDGCIFCRAKRSRDSFQMWCPHHEYLAFMDIKEVSKYMLVNQQFERDSPPIFPSDPTEDPKVKELRSIALALKHIVAEFDKADLVKTFQSIIKDEEKGVL